MHFLGKSLILAALLALTELHADPAMPAAPKPIAPTGPDTGKAAAATCAPKFIGKLKLRSTSTATERRLARPLAFLDSHCNVWTAPSGMNTDGASIPAIATKIVGLPFEAGYLPAAVLHDWYCDRRSQPWRDVHRMFYEAMLANGVDQKKAKLMYAAVYLRGPRWTKQAVINNRLLNTAALPDVMKLNLEIFATYSKVQFRNFIFSSKPWFSLFKTIEENNLDLNEIDSLAEQIRMWDGSADGVEEWLAPRLNNTVIH